MKNKRADRVWLRLAQSYGARIVESYGKDMPQPWADAVENLTDEQIQHGIKAVIRISPVHPPTLGEFEKACLDMPVAQHENVATIQEQLCSYAMLKLEGRLTDREKSRPWTYVYRHWLDGAKRCAECTGVVIDLDNGDRMGFSVASMQADTAAYQAALRYFRPGPRPTRQLDLGSLPDLRA